MKKTDTPTMRKVYGQTTNAQDIQMNAVRKINSLLSSGAVSVTGPTQPRILKQQPKTVFVQKGECYVCDEHIGNNGTLVTEAITNITNTKIPTKIGRIVGDAYMVIVSVDDVICKRCLSMFNHMDRLENDLDRVKTNILGLINKKYGINDNADNSGSNAVDIKPPPTKVQRLNTSGGINATYANRKTSNGGEVEDDVTPRKVNALPLLQPIQTTQSPGQTRLVTVSNNSDAIDSQLSSIFETNAGQQQQNSLGQSQIVRRQVNAAVAQVAQPTAQQKKLTKIYKCMLCDFKTTDLKQFQPHYDTCQQQNGYRCKICKKLFPNVAAFKAHNAEKHASEFTCSICSINFMNEAMVKKHMETNHSDVKTIETSSSVVTGSLYSCNLCSYKSVDKTNFDEHMRKHVKVKPFKCRICAARFETRDQADIHAKNHYFKCGTCSAQFMQREQLMKHLETHKPQQKMQVQYVQQAQLVSQDLTTQKLLQESIDEALRDTSETGQKMQFFSCETCSLTFIQEDYYKNHMEAHEENNKKTVTSSTATTTPTSSSANSLIRQDQRVTSTPSAIIQTQPNTSISDNDLEIMFEKLHSDKTEIEGNAATAEGLVITSQESSTGGYTFNITMPSQHESSDNNTDLENKTKTEGLASVGIDMPVLDPGDDQQLQQSTAEQQQNQNEQHQEHIEGDQHTPSGPVSMPSLDDDTEASQPSNTDQVPMDLDDIQNAAESGQIKFILNENGQLIQLDNHILTTDADGNQILVQATDSEQIQQLLQSVGLQAGDGEGEQTFQMIQGENNQMILVHGDNNEAQLIDAHMLNEEGHLVIQQHGDGELPEGMHVVNEDGVQVPVSIAFAQHLDQSHVEQQHQQELEQHHEAMQQDGNQLEQNEHLEQEKQEESEAQQQEQPQTQEDLNQTASIKIEDSSQDGSTQVSSAESEITSVTTSTTAPVTSTTGEVYFNLDELMSQPDSK